MEIIDLPRSYGKTEIAIRRAHETGYPIIVATADRKCCIKRRIKEKGYKDIDVYTVSEWLHKGSYKQYKYIIIDELDSILYLLLNATVEMVTLTSKGY